MIRNKDELMVVRKQLVRVEDALDSLRAEVLPKNARNFEVLAEGYVEQIQVLRADIEAYLGLIPKLQSQDHKPITSEDKIDLPTIEQRQ